MYEREPHLQDLRFAQDLVAELQIEMREIKVSCYTMVNSQDAS